MGTVWGMDKTQAAARVEDARTTRQISWSDLAEAMDRPLLWSISALLGQQPMTPGQAATVTEMLGLDEEVGRALQRQPTRGTGVAALPTDPTLYRFYEALTVYGPAMKEALHEEFGDGIMSAINFRMSLERVPDPDGDRVVVTFDGKFLPYQW